MIPLAKALAKAIACSEALAGGAHCAGCTRFENPAFVQTVGIQTGIQAYRSGLSL